MVGNLAILPDQEITMGSLGIAFKAFFTAFTTSCAVLQAIAQMCLNFAQIGEEESKSLLDQSQHDRAVALAKLNAELTTTPVLPAP